MKKTILTVLISAAIGASYSGVAMSEGSAGPKGAFAAPQAEPPIAEAAVVPSGPYGTELIDFESDALGSKPNGWQSDDSANASFTDSNGTGLSTGTGLPVTQVHGVAGLFVDDDHDDSHLIIDFAQRMRAISIDFGNDDPDWSEEGDEAVLSVSIGGAPLASTQMVMNRNDIMDQTISLSDAGCFDQATFKYDVDPANGLIEAVDDIGLELCGGAVLKAGGKTVCTGGNESNGSGDGNGKFTAINECDGPAGFWSADGFSYGDAFVSAMVVLPETAMVATPVTPDAAWEYTGTPTAGSYFEYKQKEPEVTLTCTGTPQGGATATITDLGAVLSGWLYTCLRPDGYQEAQYTVADQTWLSGTGGKGRDKDRGSVGDFGGTLDFMRGMVETYEPE